jgi:hypothetical protein
MVLLREVCCTGLWFVKILKFRRKNQSKTGPKLKPQPFKVISMMMQRSNTIYKHDPNIVARMIGGEMILVPIRKNVGDMENIYTLNETAARIWELVDGQHSLEEI